MKIRDINNGIYMISMNINHMLFEGMWDLPNGVSLNSYIVKGEKIAIIDGFIGWDGVSETLYESLAEININPEDIDYLIVNHMEPDHSGWIEKFKEINTKFEVITTKKGKEIIEAFFEDEINVRVVEEGYQLDLGNEKMLSFHPVPNVHWPETMFTYENSTKTLFSCDMYGAFGVLGNDCYFDDLSDEEKTLFENETIRYFSNVLTTFSSMVDKAIKKTKELDVSVIATGHGPLYNKSLDYIIDSYAKYCQYAKGFGNGEVTILWGSMYGMTEIGVRFAKNYLENKGIKVNSIQLPQSNESEVVTNVFKSSGVVLAMPTYEYKMFPPLSHAIDELGRKRIVSKEAFRFGSYGWSGGAQKELDALMEQHKMKWNFVDSVEFAGKPNQDDLDSIKAGLDQLIENINLKTI
jgi:flavorubredoxin